MSYRLKKKETITEGICRVIDEQTEQALVALTESEDQHEGIYDARKCFKRIRAALRLARPALGNRYNRENARYRDAGRRFSEARDAEAMIETWDALQEWDGSNLDPNYAASIREALVERYQRMIEASNLTSAIEEVVATLEAARAEMHDWPTLPDKFDTLGDALKKTYRRGRKAMARAYDDPQAEHFHNWRKRVKYSWYHMRLLQDIWSPLLTSYKEELKNLADTLGDDHDLVVLTELIAQEPHLFGNARARKELCATIAERQTQLRTEAYFLSQRIYAAPPSALVDMLEQSWQAWHNETADVDLVVL
ncbi:MAG: CHAD domain-containing protein [Chloroflexaceae bacterium]|nr:CHAD domain-containing protein [Chloroflexaceae bacterium]NJL33516.1 CHAD domain-containing protein [Chloroflexaceae bacterium]NJO05848.1 CHAD domain-containing protein [Chloroflexaceae bacterium]